MAINWLAVVVAAVANMVLGFLWYRVIFGKLWMRLMGKTEMTAQGGANIGYAINAAVSLVAAALTAWFVGATGMTTLAGGIEVGILGWLGFTATSAASDYVFSGRGPQLYLINEGYRLVGFGVMGAIVGAWH